MRVVRTTGTSGAALGVFFGCFIALGNLFLIDLSAANRLKRKEELKGIFTSVVDCAESVMHMQDCAMWLHSACEAAWDESGVSLSDELWVAHHSEGGSLLELEAIPVNDDMAPARCFRTASTVQVPGTADLPPLLCVPIISPEHKTTIGVIAVRRKRGDARPFSGMEEKLLRMLADHAAIFVHQLAD